MGICVEYPIAMSPRRRLITAVAAWIGNLFATVQPEMTRHRRLALFRTVLADFDGLISRICFGYSRTQEEFEDLRQDVMVNIWQGMERFRGEAELKTWVYRVTLNTCVSTLRRRRSEGAIVPISEFADLIDESDDRLALLVGLQRAIGSLPSLDKAVVLLWLDEMSYDDIASVMGMTRGAVATRLHRAKDKLKKLMI